MNAAFFTSNRQRLTHQLKGGTIVLGAYFQMQRGNDAAFRFEQEANFWWLTGIEEPEWELIIDGTRGKSWLVQPNVSETHEIFDGSLSAAEAKKVSGVDDVLSRDEADTMLRDLAAKHSVVYTLGEHPAKEHYDFISNPATKRLYASLSRIFNDVQDCRRDIARLRAIKQPEEIAAIKKAIKLTVSAFQDVKVLLPELKKEYEIE